MTYSLANIMYRSLRVLLGIGAISALAIQGVYVYKFAYVPNAWFQLSNDPAVWGQYGDYIGGLLNPIFSSLAFGGLVVTIVLQARQIDEARKSSELEEIQRVQSSVAARIDVLLSAQPVFRKIDSETVPHSSAFTVARTVYELLAAMGTMALHHPDGDRKHLHFWLWNDDKAKELRKSLEFQTHALRLELNSIAFMLTKYAENDGSPIVLSFYRYRFDAICVWFDSLKLLHHHDYARSFFETEKGVKSMKEKI